MDVVVILYCFSYSFGGFFVQFLSVPSSCIYLWGSWHIFICIFYCYTVFYCSFFWMYFICDWLNPQIRNSHIGRVDCTWVHQPYARCWQYIDKNYLALTGKSEIFWYTMVHFGKGMANSFESTEEGKHAYVLESQVTLPRGEDNAAAFEKMNKKQTWD